MAIHHNNRITALPHHNKIMALHRQGTMAHPKDIRTAGVWLMQE